MDINFEYYKIFYTIAKTGSISRAAEKLFVSQPAITQTLKKLETKLNTKLFYRAGKGIKLTEEGINLYNYLENSIEILNNAEEKLKQSETLESGTVKIRTGRANAKLVLYEPLKQFMKAYPNIKVELSRGAPSDSLKMLNNGELDILILNTPSEINMANIEVTPLIEKEYVFAMSKKYKESNNVIIKNIQDLKKYPLIASYQGSSYRKILDKYFGGLNDLNIHYQIMIESFKKDLILENLGISFLRIDEIEGEIKKRNCGNH